MIAPYLFRSEVPLSGEDTEEVWSSHGSEAVLSVACFFFNLLLGSLSNRMIK